MIITNNNNKNETNNINNPNAIMFDPWTILFLDITPIPFNFMIILTLPRPLFIVRFNKDSNFAWSALR